MIDTAVIPAAGYGSRMRPLTISVPKEMFPLGPLPMIEYTLRELVASGIKRICVVIRKGKEVIKEYISQRKELYSEVEFSFVYQNASLGLGDAIRMSKEFINKNPFVMAIPDQILLSEIPATRQLLDRCKETEGIWNSMIKISAKEMSFFKDARPFQYKSISKNLFLIEDISSDRSSLVRGFGRTIFLPETLEYMTEDYINDKTGEIDLLKTYNSLKKKFLLYGIILKGIPCDLGTWAGYYYYQQKILNYLDSQENFIW